MIVAVQASDDIARLLAPSSTASRLSFNPLGIAAKIAGVNLADGFWFWSPDTHLLRRWPKARTTG